MSRTRRALRRLAIALAALLLLALALATGGTLWLRGRLQASLPLLDGELALTGLSRPVTVERDAFGVPTIHGSSRLDVARATGFVHGQERFFQMDLMRRGAAGELAALVGPALLQQDRDVRVHRFRALAERRLGESDDDMRAALEAYAAGVNAGLAALGAPPPEYVLLRGEAEPWRPEDTLLVVDAMYLQLQSDLPRREAALGVLADRLPAEVVAFLVPAGTEWDAPVDGEPLATPAVPGPGVLDLRGAPAGPAPEVAEAKLPAPVPGSNSWAVDGRHTADGAALLANDMHLGLSLPNIWFRVVLEWPDERGGLHRVVGVTLPGAPPLIVGSNGHVAWGFTNSQIDTADLVVLETDPQDDDVYSTPDGPRRLEHFAERIAVRGRPDEPLDVAWTIWGPVIDRDPLGRRRALRWVAHDAEAVDLGLLRMELAADVDEALAIAARTGLPTQNCVVAGAGGRIGWTLMGPIPRRVGLSGRWPASWADGSRRWDGYLEPRDYPRIVDPPGGRIWTANNRVVGGAMLERLGDAAFVLGARARQIRDDLLALERATETDLLAVQLDDRAVLLERWRALLIRVLEADGAAGAQRGALLQAARDDWPGRAAIDSVGYRAVRAFRLFLAEDALGAITASCKAVDPDFDPLDVGQWEGPLWRLVEARPPHLLDPRHASWDAALLTAADRVAGRFFENGRPVRAAAAPWRGWLRWLLPAVLGPPRRRLGRRVEVPPASWGERNTVALRHPLSRGVPALAEWLDIPSRPLPGDGGMPRVQSPRFGASERMVVAPGREESGIFHMPGGQSGHFLSPQYRMGHEAWERGLPAPLLPGESAHHLTLLP